MAGMLVPLLLSDNGDGSYKLLAGTRRLAAAKKIGMKFVPGVVVDPRVLLKEVEELKRKGVLRDPSRLRVSGRAHVILDWHTALDKAREEARREGAIGTTGRGIGPAYEDKVARCGIRIADLLDPESLRPALERLAKEKNFELVEYYRWQPVDPDAMFTELVDLGRRLEPYVDHTSQILDRALREGRSVLFEGAQGVLLDLTWGTYPFVTSSSCLPGSAATSCGVGPSLLGPVIGIMKAYVTRVGEGPFPTELEDENGEPLQHCLLTSCFAEHAVVQGAGAVPLPEDVPLWQAALLGCGVITGVGAVRNTA